MVFYHLSTRPGNGERSNMIDSVVLRPFVDTHEANQIAVDVHIKLKILPEDLAEEVRSEPGEKIAVAVWGRYGCVTDNNPMHIGFPPVDTETRTFYDIEPTRYEAFKTKDRTLTYHVQVKSLLPGEVYAITIDNIAGRMLGRHEVVVKFR